MSKTFKWSETQVGLFPGLFRNAAQVAGLESMLEQYIAWNDDLKSRRDPSAHRMPLYVPPAGGNGAP